MLEGQRVVQGCEGCVRVGTGERDAGMCLLCGVQWLLHASVLSWQRRLRSRRGVKLSIGARELYNPALTSVAAEAEEQKRHEAEHLQQKLRSERDMRLSICARELFNPALTPVVTCVLLQAAEAEERKRRRAEAAEKKKVAAAPHISHACARRLLRMCGCRSLLLCKALAEWEGNVCEVLLDACARVPGSMCVVWTPKATCSRQHMCGLNANRTIDARAHVPCCICVIVAYCALNIGSMSVTWTPTGPWTL
eukprot:1151201-Pelagomonas_calceolata.AAC.1